MRKFQQKQILELLGSIKEAQQAGAYGDCQEAALFLCDFIDDIVGEGSQTASLLMEYCELLSKAHSGDLNEKHLRRHLVKIENNANNELKPTRTEIVFLSYKAAMSDSIESIYLAAKSDPSCDAYWIPIPYYDRNPDGSFGQMHYEGQAHYPDYIECINWQEYDIEKREPDSIFTFNPFDDSNLVTCVHPDFYCRRLRELTDMLVYVPYYVSGEVQSATTEEALRDMSDVVKSTYLPIGAFFAHKIIAPSERERAIWSRLLNSDKVLALGSPKLDKIINSRREDFTLPNKWQDIIAGKKVILFCSTIATMLQNNQEYINKLRYILGVFRKRADVVLWWRPHPLMMSTFLSMRPQFADEYKQIVDSFVVENYGIYDSDADLHRAIAFADGFYGEGASVSAMFPASGKPMMMINTEIFEYINTPEVNFAYFMSNGRALLGFRGVSGLFDFDKASGEVEFALSLNEYFDINYWHKASYGRPSEVEGKLYFAPILAKELAVWDTRANSIEYIAFDLTRHLLDKPLYFTTSVSFGVYVFLIPYFYPAILRLDTRTNEIIYIDDWIGHIVLNGTRLDRSYFVNLPQIVDNKMWLACHHANIILELDMLECSSIIHEVGEKNYYFGIISYDDDNFWIAPPAWDQSSSPIIKWHPDRGIIYKFEELYPENDENIKQSFIVDAFDGKLWLVPVFSKHFVTIDTNNSEIAIIQELDDDCTHANSEQAKFRSINFINNYIYAFKQQNNTCITCIEFDRISRVRREISIKFSKESISRINKQRKILSCHMMSLEQTELNKTSDFWKYESEHASLDDFIDFVINKDEHIKSNPWAEFTKNMNSDGSAGQAIFDFIKRLQRHEI